MKRKGEWPGTEATGKRTHLDSYVDGDLDMDAQDERQGKTRRGRVMTEGYDSDDSDEGPSKSHRRGWKDKNDGATDEEEDDMFAEKKETEGEEQDDVKKEPRFLKLSEIDGQEFGARTRMGDDDDNDELDHEEDPEYELEQALKSQQHEDANADAERTPPGSPRYDGVAGVKKQGMGFRIEKFNMKAEMASGQFDEDGNYIRNKRDQFSQNDRWLEGNYTKKSIKAASDAQKKRQEVEKERMDKEMSEFPTMERAMKELAEHMQPGETVLDALHRLGSEAKRCKKDQERAAPSKAVFERFTDVTSVLMNTFGQMNVYDDVYEGLVRMVRRAGLVAEDWDPSRKVKEVPHGDEAIWEYKWTPAYLAHVAKAQGTNVDPETKVFGPFRASELRAWADQGFFGPSKENILVRRSHATDGLTWASWTDAEL
ncbi:hypothetical protein MEQU1_000204 [Malassezia equina]|uniref:GYF domain-containing protein n=1 Tax=Malassezia equina TaxID=1381935 RepID=A0AAF0EBF1_9BASI|nr:hypothetical protein MEQU1_000204 [Malassezia equina]